MSAESAASLWRVSNIGREKNCPNYFALLKKNGTDGFSEVQRNEMSCLDFQKHMDTHKSQNQAGAESPRCLSFVQSEEVIKETNYPHVERQKCACMCVCERERGRDFERERESSSRKILLSWSQCPLFIFWLMIFLGSDCFCFCDSTSKLIQSFERFIPMRNEIWLPLKKTSWTASHQLNLVFRWIMRAVFLPHAP